ncbi:MAG: hypothetical protein NVSMB25_16980 [Thermoleophilaceae bacterium]
MGALRQADLRAALDFIVELGHSEDLESCGTAMVAGVRRLIPADVVACNWIDLRAAEAIVLVDPPEALFPESEEVLDRYGIQNHIVAPAACEPRTRALKVSALVGGRDFCRTSIDNYLFCTAGLKYRMACGLSGWPTLVVDISLNRSSCDFSERERALLDLLRPHLVQAYDRTAARSLSQAMLAALEDAHGEAGRAVVMLTPSGAIKTATPIARRWLDELFGAQAHVDALPEPLAVWLRRRRGAMALDGEELNDEPVYCADSAHVTIRPLAAGLAGHTLLVLERRDQPSTERLQGLGLSPRQAEILEVVAQGLSDAATAELLHISAHTVGKHLEHIYQKLGVRTRTAAAAVLSQI